MPAYVMKDTPASPCSYCDGRQEGQCASPAAVPTCGVFRVAHGYRLAVHFVGFRG